MEGINFGRNSEERRGEVRSGVDWEREEEEML
jgi:hypothetical protein